MVTENKPVIPVLVRFIIERYVDRSPEVTSPDMAHKIVLESAQHFIDNRPDESLVAFADYFDIVASSAYDRYADDEEHLADESGRDGTGEPTDLGDEDRYSVELIIVARYKVHARTKIEAKARTFALIDDLISDVHGDSIEEYATNLSCSDIHNNKR